MNLVGRYLKYIGSRTNGVPKFGDYFLVESMKDNGLLRLSDNQPNCCWQPDNYLPNFELMHEGFNPMENLYEIY